MVNVIGSTNARPVVIAATLSHEGPLRKDVGNEWIPLTGVSTPVMKFGGFTMPARGRLTHLSLSSVDKRGNPVRVIVHPTVNGAMQSKYFIVKSGNIIGDSVKFPQPLELQTGDVLGLKTAADAMISELSTATLLVELSL